MAEEAEVRTRVTVRLADRGRQETPPYWVRKAPQAVMVALEAGADRVARVVVAEADPQSASPWAATSAPSSKGTISIQAAGVPEVLEVPVAPAAMAEHKPHSIAPVLQANPRRTVLAFPSSSTRTEKLAHKLIRMLSN